MLHRVAFILSICYTLGSIIGVYDTIRSGESNLIHIMCKEVFLMGLLGGLCKAAGVVAGVYVGGSLGLIGSAIGSQKLEDIATSLSDASFELGVKVGDAVDEVAREVAENISLSVNSLKTPETHLHNSIGNTPAQNDFQRQENSSRDFITADVWEDVERECRWSRREIADYYGYSDYSEQSPDEFLDDL